MPGALINVRRLTEELNISRTPLREALAQMEAQDLVTIMPQRGVKINALTVKQLRDIFEVLSALECITLDFVFKRITPKMIEQMEQINEKMASFIENGKNRQYHDADIQLHKVFLDLSDNNELTNTVGMLKLRVFGFAMGRYRDGFKRAIVDEHRILIDLIRSGKKEAAITFLKEEHWIFKHPENLIDVSGVDAV